MKYLLGVIGVVFLVIVAIFLIVTRSPGGADEKSGRPATRLIDEARRGSVSFTQQGRVVGEEERRSIRVTVDSNQVRVEVLKGYTETIEKSQTFPNSSQGYETFLASLEVAGFANRRDYKPEDERGVCPLGRTFIYQVRRSGEDKLRLWSTSCSAKQGTFAGKAQTILQLFQNQVPGYGQFSSGVRL